MRSKFFFLLFVLGLAASAVNAGDDCSCSGKCDDETEVWNDNPGKCDPKVITTCEEYLSGEPNGCPDDDDCDDDGNRTPRCDCKNGYYRDDDGNCVPKDQCCGGKNEVVKSCPADYDMTCDGKKFRQGKCEGNKHCCRCLPGYLRDCKGRCIKKEKCPCKDNEEMGYLPCPANRKCDKQQACKCKKGYVRDNKENCIKKEDVKCNEGEELIRCADICPREQRCSTIFDGGKVKECDALPPKWHCKYRCECKQGYVRVDGKCVKESKCCDDDEVLVNDCDANDDLDCDEKATNQKKCNGKCCRCPSGNRRYNGDCIPKEECPPKCGKNQMPGTPPCPKDRVCKNTKKVCICVKGYIMNDKDECVDKKTVQCSDGEELNECADICSLDETCETTIGDKSVLPCGPIPDNYHCKYKCKCKNGYVRLGSKCVPQDKCCKDNETVMSCKGICDDTTCEDKPYKDPKPCNKNACRCVKGYVRDKHTSCIKKEKCIPKCGALEIFNCLPVPPGRPKQPCKKACTCQKGYFWNKIQCIKECEIECGDNQVVDQCLDIYTKELTCDDLFKGIKSKPASGALPADYRCNYGCVCDEGYYKKGDECVKPCECCNDDNEVLKDCPTNNDQTCDGKPFNNKPCEKKCCRCEDGYVRDKKGRCIKKKNCPKGCKTCDGANEVWKDCGTPDGTCDDPEPDCDNGCKPGCYCEKNHVRDDDGKCIPKNKCKNSCEDDD